MGDENPIRTLGDYSKPSHEGYRNTIELPARNNVVPPRSDTIRVCGIVAALRTISLSRDIRSCQCVSRFVLVPQINDCRPVEYYASETVYSKGSNVSSPFLFLAQLLYIFNARTSINDGRNHSVFSTALEKYGCIAGSGELMSS
ncbi:hypothetical protein Tco_0109556 [Tanacetum coccineum]